MRLSKRTEYGVCAVVQLARVWPHGFVQSRDLAKREAMPSKFLEAILLALRRGGFLESKIGREGGYRLSRAPREIMMGEVVRRLEGRLSVTEIRTAPTHEPSPGETAVHLLNEKLTQATDGALDDMTLEQLVEQSARSGGVQQMYYI
jgi:Rrf2 family protein